MCGKRDNILALAGNFVTEPKLLSVFLIVSHTSYKVTSAIRYLKIKNKKKNNVFQAGKCLQTVWPGDPNLNSRTH